MPIVKLPDGEQVEFPDTMTDEQIESAISSMFTKRSGMEEAARIGELAASGFVDSASSALGAIPELASSGLRYAGLPAAEPGFYPRAIKGGMQALGETISKPVYDFLGMDIGKSEPSTGAERFAYGAGRGAADAASFMLPGAAIAKAAKAGGTLSRVGQAMSTAPTMQAVSGAIGGGTEEATDSQLAGLAAGIAVPSSPAILSNLTRRTITPFASQLSANEQRLMREAKSAGIPLTPGQETGSTPLRSIESAWARMPFTSAPQAEVYDAQRKAFNKAVLSKVGVEAEEATPEVLDKAWKAASKNFDDAYKKVERVNVDQKLNQDISEVAEDYASYFGADGSARFNQVLKQLNKLKISEADDVTAAYINSESFGKMSSKIKQLARGASDPYEKQGLLKFAEVMDDALERSASPDVRKEVNNARRVWRNMKIIDDAAARSTASDRASGNISFGALSGAVKKSDKSGYARGRGDINQMSRIGDFMAAQRIPDSGTAQRMSARELLTGGGLVGAGAVYDPMTLGILGGAAIGGPKLAQMAARSPVIDRYLRNQALARMPRLDVMSPSGQVGLGQEIGNMRDQDQRRIK